MTTLLEKLAEPDLLDEEKILDRDVEGLDDKFYTLYDTVVLTCYFNTKEDPQRKGVFVESSSYEYIKPWYETMLAQNLHGIIFHDNLSEEFILKYQTDKIIFRRATLGYHSINDERFIIWYRYLLHNPYAYALVTDVSDVLFNKNPFDLLKNPAYKEKFFVGMNVIGMKPVKRTPLWYDRRKWKIDFFNETLKKTGIDPVGYQKNTFQIYNPGLLGATREVVLAFLSKLNRIHLASEKKKNYNMLTTNYILVKHLIEEYDPLTYKTKYIESGYPFNSIYKKDEKIGESIAYLIHK